jgi:hypothetical protein
MGTGDPHVGDDSMSIVLGNEVFHFGRRGILKAVSANKVLGLRVLLNIACLPVDVGQRPCRVVWLWRGVGHIAGLERIRRNRHRVGRVSTVFSKRCGKEVLEAASWSGGRAGFVSESREW